MSDLLSISDKRNQNVTVEYSKYDSSIQRATIDVNSDLEQSLTVSAIKDVEFNVEGDTLTTVDLQISAKDNLNTVNLVLTKDAVKDLLLITNKMYNHLTK